MIAYYHCCDQLDAILIPENDVIITSPTPADLARFSSADPDLYNWISQHMSWSLGITEPLTRQELMREWVEMYGENIVAINDDGFFLVTDKETWSFCEEQIAESRQAVLDSLE